MVQHCAPSYASHGEHRYGSTFQAAEALAEASFESRQRSRTDAATRVEAIVGPARDAGADAETLEWAIKCSTFPERSPSQGTRPVLFSRARSTHTERKTRRASA